MIESGQLENLDCETNRPFDPIWERLNQSNLSPLELKALLSASCSILRLDHVPSTGEGFHIGFSFGRWDTLAAPSIGCSLGVLHYIPDIPAALVAFKRVIKSEAPLLLFLYYRFVNPQLWFCTSWRASYLPQGGISWLVQGFKSIMTDPLIASVYWPLARLGWDWRKRVV